MLLNIRFIYLLIVLLSFLSCDSDNSKIHFYHWKIDANLSEIEKSELDKVDHEKVYIHYFDVVVSEDVINPVAVIRKVDKVLKEKEIIPVVFIRNTVFKNKNTDIKKLVTKVIKLTEQIHKHHFNKKPTEIQIDCDWSATTKEAYFKFLTLLKEKVTLSATIRLHQIKYKNETGVPPVAYGALMLYNVGDLKNFEENSILNTNIVSQYINKESVYPLILDIALPLFSQVVIRNKEGKIKLINHVFSDDFEKDTIHFQKKTGTIYEVKEKFLYKGHYLYKGFTVKLEKSDVNEVLKSLALVKDSNLQTRNTLLYHLDEITLKQFNIKELLEKI